MKRNDQLPDFSVNIAELNKATGLIVIKPDKQFFSSAQRKLKPYKALPYIFRPAMEKIGDHVRTQMIPQTFKDEGPGWAPLARRTVAERIQAGFEGRHPILRRSGDLFKSLTQKSHPEHYEVIKVGKNARIEIGSTSKKFLENQRGLRQAHLPARPMIPGTGNIPLKDRDRIAMRAIVMKEIQRKLA